MNRKKVFKWLDKEICMLEQEIFCLDPDEEEWSFFFQMLRSYDQFKPISYREQLLIGIMPECMLETPYCTEEYVDPPRAHCYTMADFHRYSQPDWMGLTGSALTGRLPQNEFGYLHPGDSQSFLGITRQTYDRLYALYRRCPAWCREEADRALLAMTDFILDVLDGISTQLSLSFE